MPSLPSELRRYHRQILLPGFGVDGQRKLGSACAVVVGCGALGTVSADLLARAGVGHIRLIDRDIVEWTNLQRQTLFDEQDARDGVPKAAAAAARLMRVNSTIRIEGIISDLHAGNAEELLLGGRDPSSHGSAEHANSEHPSRPPRTVIVDATDNFEARYLVNDICVKHGIPWVYGGAVGTRGMQATFLPGDDRPCLRCIFPEPPERGESPTCDTAGVLGPIPGIVAACQVVDAIKLLIGLEYLVSPTLLDMDPWNGERRRIELRHAKDIACPCCVSRRFEYLTGAKGAAESGGGTAAVCGRDAVQVRGDPQAPKLDLQRLASRLRGVGEVTVTPWLVRAKVDDRYELTVFADGRAIIGGTTDLGQARSLYARYVGA